MTLNQADPDPEDFEALRILEKRVHYLERIRQCVEDAVRICDQAQDYFSSHFDQAVFDRTKLRTILESTMEDVVNAIEDDHLSDQPEE